MKKTLALAVLLSYIYQLHADTAATRQSILQEIKADLAKIEATPAPAAQQTPPPAKSTVTKKTVSQPVKPQPVIKPVQKPTPKPAPKKVVSRSVGLPLVPSAINPTVQIINTTALNINVYTSNVAGSGPGQYGQTAVPVDPYSSATMPLTSQSQRFVAAQVSFDDTTGDAGLLSNSAPINLKTPWAIIDTKKVFGQDDCQLQYLPALEQNGIILINPSDKPYTIKIMNKFAEQIDVENTGNQNPAYLILTIPLPALTSVPLPVVTNSTIRLHIEYQKNGQVTKVDYPTNAGFYVIQELSIDDMPPVIMRNNNTTPNSTMYLNLQQIDG